MSDDLLDDLLADSDEEIKSTDPPPQPVAPRRVSPRKKAAVAERSPKKAAPAALGTVGKKAAPVESGHELNDAFFKIRIKNASVNGAVLASLSDGMQKVGILTVQATAPDSSWMTMGVLVDKSTTLKSSNGNDYLIWKMHDLRNCTERPRKVLLFGEAAKTHWKLQPGSVLALLSPQISPPDQKDKERPLKIVKATQVLPLGISADLGRCKGRKPDGTPCGQIVNETRCEMCVFHAGAEARRLAARRGAFNQLSLPPQQQQKRLPHQQRPALPAKPLLPRPSVPMGDSTHEQVHKAEKDKLNQLLSSHSFGARTLSSMTDIMNGVGGEEGKEPKKAKPVNMKEFMYSQRTSPRKALKNRTAKEEMAIKRALAVLEAKKAKGETEKRAPVKRKRDNDEDASGSGEGDPAAAGRARVLQLLAKRNKHENEAEEAEREMENSYLDSLEKREQMEDVVTTCTELKDLRVFSCEKCGYTARSRSDRCIKLGHSTTSHLADKRFFRCQQCKTRATAYGLLPTKPCAKCGGKEWKRVAMQDERKLTLENEKLLLRGEERTFINS